MNRPLPAGCHGCAVQQPCFARKGTRLPFDMLTAPSKVEGQTSQPWHLQRGLVNRPLSAGAAI